MERGLTFPRSHLLLKLSDRNNQADSVSNISSESNLILMTPKGSLQPKIKPPYKNHENQSDENGCTPENIEELNNVMTAIYEGTRL